MIDKLLLVLQKEDKKNPMTDEEIAKVLKINREKVNELRQQSDIPNHLERREAVLLETINDLLIKDNTISLRKLTIQLNKEGFNISTFGLNKYKSFISEIRGDKYSQNKEIVHNNRKKSYEEENFSDIIGNGGSLRQVIKLAKAAVLYPPHGLHTLIVGSTGVGKSQLVEQIHSFAKKIRNSNELPLVIFNCADYRHNPQLLVSQLFGHIKGSFTGADSDKEGLVEKADEGILFLDEIHRLPPEGQEILFRIIDKGEFSRLGETNSIRKVRLMIIGATTENIESNLLSTFRRRIPVLIEIPSLEERPIIERMQLVNKFFVIEAVRINKELQISEEVIKRLLIYKCPGNIGQLKSDIQVICARAFLNFLHSKDNKVKIVMNDLPNHLKNQLFNIEDKRQDIELVNIKELIILPIKKAMYNMSDDVFKYNIYQFIEKRTHQLKRNNNSSEEIKQIVAKELEERIRVSTSEIESKYSGISRKLLQDIVGEEVINVVDDIRKIVLSEIGTADFSIFNILCLHISEAIERLRMGKQIINPKLEDIQKNYKKEYKIALKLIDVLKLKLGLDFPEDEAGFIALYLNKFFVKDENHNEKKVGLIIVTHGDVSKAMLDIAQSIVGIKHGVAITMSINEKPEEVFKRVREVAQKVNEGRGVLLLVDMGSLITFGELITDELGIPTRTVSRVDTLMVVEAIRKSVFSSSSLNSVYNSMLELERLLPRTVKKRDKYNSDKKKRAIISTCITGKGTSLKIKQMVEEKLKSLKIDVDVISLGLIESEDGMNKEIEQMEQEREIIFITGAVNPKYRDISFIPLEEILNDEKLEALMNTIKLKDLSTPYKETAIKFEEFFDPKLVRIFHSRLSHEEIINIMAKAMEKEGYVKEGYYKEVLDREVWGSSYIGNGVAVPHSAQNTNIIRPCIGIAVLEEAIEWDDGEVNIIFVLALKTEQKDLVLKLYNLVKETDMIEKIKELKTNKSIVEGVLHYVR